MGRIFIFSIIGILMMAIERVDFFNGSFIIAGPGMALRHVLLLIGNIILGIVATMSLSLKQRFILFFYLSIFSTINHLIWFDIDAVIHYPQIPIKDSVPYFLESLRIYKMSFNFITILWEIVGFGFDFLFYNGIMLVTLGFKKGYEKTKKYFGL